MKQKTDIETYGISAKGNGDCFIQKETHYTLNTGGGMPGQGYPCVLIIKHCNTKQEIITNENR